MSAFQIATLCFLCAIAVVHIAGAVVGYRVVVRRDSEASELKSSLAAISQRLTATEAALSNTLPAIERNTGEVSRFVAETNALLKALGQTSSDMLTEVRQIGTRVHTSVEHGTLIANEVRQVGPKLTAHADQRAEMAKVLAAVGDRVNGLQDMLAKVKSSIEAGSASADQSVANANARLDNVVSQIEKLRNDFTEATRF